MKSSVVLGRIFFLPLLFGFSGSDVFYFAGQKNLYSMSTDEFLRYAPAQKRIERNSVNMELLEASVFHFTNLQRAQNGRPKFKYSHKLNKIARQHSHEMASLQYFSHTSPVAKNRTMRDRLKQVGILNASAAENIAFEPAKELGSGSYEIHHDANGNEIWVDQKTRKRIDYYTYLGFGEAIVKGWMKSPGHRSNILRENYKYLGCGGARSNHQGSDVFYFTQNFASEVGEEGGR